MNTSRWAAPDLRVSPLCLGAMTFGTDWGWGADEKLSSKCSIATSRPAAISSTPPTATPDGPEREIVGKFVAERNLRDQVVIATKFTFGDAARQSQRRRQRPQEYLLARSKRSLRRLKTDYIDLYYLHAWDMITPVEEVVSTLTDLVREGKIRYYGLSDTPAWYFTRAQTLAEKGGMERCRHAAARILARRAQYRTRTHSRRAGTRHRPLPLEPARAAACSPASTSAKAKRRQRRRPAHAGESDLQQIHGAAIGACTTC